MKLFHVSEESNIDKFIPRIPTRRKEIDQSKGLVWALTEQALPNFLTPRACPRVGYRVNDKTTQDDISKFFSSSSRHCVAIEHDWHAKMLETTLYIYEFDITNFYPGGGFYVSEETEIPVSVTKYENLYDELFKRNVEVRILNNLWELGEAVKKSSLTYSLCCMGNAKPKPN
jgi:hypothetical protein